MRQAVAAAAVFLLLGTAISAHVMVSPPRSKPGITQTYELRIRNESTVATTAVELQIPADVTVISVASPPVGTVETPKLGTRVTGITWHVTVEPSKYVALKFDARNPGSGELHWNIRQEMADGSVVDWSDAPGAKQKASVTTLGDHDSGTEAHEHADHDHRHH